ncbi:MAG: hypothetical protein AAF418_06110 [Pseudomonadota bacterium]
MNSKTPETLRTAPEQLQQINISWDQREDRIVLRASTTHAREFRFWITFRMYRLISAAFDKLEDSLEPTIADNPEQAAKLREMKRAEALERYTFKTQDSDEIPMPSEDVQSVFGEKPILLDGLHISVDGEVIILEFIGDGQKARLPLDANNIIAVRYLIDRAAGQAEWQMLQTTDHALPSQSADERTLH